ncbi:uncharacterized protein UDID_17067 [Ustilago sp. UG-2017a]|nr:uncharacterized protein UDID_17067 [Ustilago sp. UG-2017a]
MCHRIGNRVTKPNIDAPQLTYEGDRALPGRGPSLAEKGTELRDMRSVTTQGAHEIGEKEDRRRSRKESCVRDTGEADIRRKSSVNEVDTAQEGQMGQLNEEEESEA